LSKFRIDEPNPKAELLALLNANAIPYSFGEDGAVHVLFAKAGCKWETIFRFASSAVLVYGIYPFRVTPGIGDTLSRINAALVRGAFFTSEGALVMRTGADLFDTYAAYEAIARAIEYNASAIAAFWAELSRLSEHTGRLKTGGTDCG
jgi:hypothetical protein